MKSSRLLDFIFLPLRQSILVLEAEQVTKVQLYASYSIVRDVQSFQIAAASLYSHGQLLRARTMFIFAVSIDYQAIYTPIRSWSSATDVIPNAPIAFWIGKSAVGTSLNCSNNIKGENTMFWVAIRVECKEPDGSLALRAHTIGWCKRDLNANDHMYW